jgi:hypothetical protein
MDRMTLTIDIQVNKIGQKRVNLRSNLVVANLIATIKDKFSLDGDFEIHLENLDTPLPPDVQLNDTGVVDGSILVCKPLARVSETIEAIRLGIRQKLSKTFRRVYLQDERNHGEYNLIWQPSIIGRRDRRDPANNRLLAVDLDGLEESLTVSRHHACITEADGTFFIESINPNNPTFLSDRALTAGIKYPLPAGSIIRVGNLILNFHIIS